MDDLSGRTIKSYELREQIGAGGFGAVYRAFQPSVGREVAIKIILPQYANQPDFVRRFEVEAQLIARLEHPHIVPLYDYWREPDGAFLVMRWLRNNLRAGLQRGSWPAEAVARLLEQMASALTVAHRESVVHRDIKPDNILLDEDNNAYLADFGIAKDLNLRNITATGSVVGSPSYITPEQIKGEPVTARTDIYSLGLVLYELLVGEKPYPQATTPAELIHKHLSEPLPPLAGRNLPAALNEVLQTATAKDPTHRYGNVARFAAAFRAAIPSVERRAGQPLPEPLTGRELDILRLMVEGLTNEEMARKLYLSPVTVKWYVRQIYAKLDVHSRHQAIERVHSLNLLATAPQPRLLTGIGQMEDVSTSIGRKEAIGEPINPYKGLRAFQEADAADFFGRAALTEHLLGRLAEEDGGGRFLVIVGPSGGGKSSVVRAGLIPALRRGGLPTSARWFISEMLPGTHPLEELEAALLRVSVNPIPGLLDQLTEDRRGLVRAAKRILPPDQEVELLLVIDQFEELFTLVEDEAVRAHFIDNLLAAVTDSRSNVRVVLTLRADFYDRPLHYPRLAELVRSYTEVIVPLTPAELERAIAGPAERVGLGLEHGLVATMVNDIGQQPGALPLLQYALTELYERREGLTLTMDTYRELGGISGALARRADELFLSLDEAGQATTRQLFLRLVTLGEGTEDTRRRVLFNEVLSIAEDGRVMEEVIDTFTQYRLLTLDHDLLTRGPTLEVAHEALIREWGRLREWLNESRDDIRLQRQLSTLADDWERSQQEASFLLHGSRLEMFDRWSQETNIALSEGERGYLTASLAEQERRALIEQEQQARELRLAQSAIANQRRAANRLHWLVGVMLVGVIAALGLSGVAVNNANEAQYARSTSDANFSQAQEQSIVNGAQLALANSNTDLALALAVVANNGSNPSAQAQVVLAQAAYTPGTVHVIRGHFGAVHRGVFSPDGKLILTLASGGDLYLSDATTGELVHILAGSDSEPYPCCAIFSPDGSTVATARGSTVILYDVATGAELNRFSTNDIEIWGSAMAFSLDGRTLLIGLADSTIRLWDIQTGRAIRIFTGHDASIESVAYNPDGTRFVSGSKDKTFIVWDAATGDIIHRFNEDQTTHKDSVWVVTFSPDGNIIASGSTDTTLAFWDAHTFNLIRSLKLENGPSPIIEFSHDGRYLATGEGNFASIIDVSTGMRTIALHGHADYIPFAAFSPDDRYLLTGAFDNTARIWDLQSGAETASPIRLPGMGFSMALSPDGAYLLVGTVEGPTSSVSTGHITLYDTATGAEVRRFGDYGVAYPKFAMDMGFVYLPIVFSPDGQQALSSTVTKNASGDSESSFRLWDIATGTIIRESSTIPFDPGWDFAQVAGLSFSPDGGRFVAVTNDGMVTIRDTQTGEVTRSFGWDDGSYSAVFSPDGRTVLAGETLGTVALWDAESGQLIRRFGVGRTGHSVRIHALAFSHNGGLAASGSDDGTVIVWDVESGQLLHRFVGHQGGIWSIAFSPDDTMLLTGSVDTNIILWNIATGEAIRRYTQHNGRVTGIVFMPDGQHFASISDDGTLRRWRIDTLSDLLTWTYANRYVPELTCTERELYRLQPACTDEVYPTRTPYATPALMPLSTIVPTLNPTITPTVVTSTLVAQRGENRGQIPPFGSDRWLYHGSAGEVLTIEVIADHVASDDFPRQDAQGNPTLNPAVAVYQANGVLIGRLSDNSMSDSNILLENLELPVTGDYWIEVLDQFFDSGGGAYTLTIERVAEE